jgi:choline dehydrogenase
VVSVGRHDYVIVGSGSGGSVVARRLVDAGASVAVIEAGGRDESPAIHDPGRWPELPYSPTDWAWQTDPQEHCYGRRLFWPRGKVLGGTSTMNGMAYIRGHRLDYDGWAYHGCPGWAWDDVLPLFKRSEDCDRGETEYRGAGGPLHVITRYEPHPLIGAMQEACLEAGIAYNDDHNSGPEIDGVGPSQLTIRDGKRQTAAVAFLHPILGDPNLTVLTDARALGLRFDGTRCTGVEIARGGTTEVVEASAEVVLAAGTIESPRLLLLSGIGPAQDLAEHGIASRVDLPGVGRNLHDHLISPVLHASPVEVPAVRPGLQHHHVHLFWRSRPGLRVPDTQPVGFHLPLGADWFEAPEHGWTWTAGLVRGRSPSTRTSRRLRRRSSSCARSPTSRPCRSGRRASCIRGPACARTRRSATTCARRSAPTTTRSAPARWARTRRRSSTRSCASTAWRACGSPTRRSCRSSRRGTRTPRRS